MLLIIGIVSGIVYLVTRDICYDMGATGYWMLPSSHVGLIFLINRFFKWVAIISIIVFIFQLIF